MIFGIFHSSSNRVCFRTIKRRKDNHLHFILVSIIITPCINHLKVVYIQNEATFYLVLIVNVCMFHLILCNSSCVMNAASITPIHGLPVTPLMIL